MQISAFVDDELPENEAELLLRRMSQDLELRQQVAEYLAVGRALRGHRSVAGIDKLRDRIAASIDDRSLHEDFDPIATTGRRYLRPLAGVAIAATVAIAALVGLQQVSESPETAPGSGQFLAVDTPDFVYDVSPDEQLREYYLRHSATTSASGASNFDARLVSLQLMEEIIDDTEVAADAENDQTDVDLDTEETAEQH